jgi:hypothetical protein
MTFMRDKVANVRETGSQLIENLVQVYKSDWVFSRLLPKLTEYLSKENSFLVRLVALKCLGVCE